MIRIVAASSPGEVRAAVTQDGALTDYAIWRPGRPDGLGDVYRARVTAHVRGMAGAFVALADGDGFLPDSDGGAGAVEGALLTVQVVRAAQGGKGARVSGRVEQTVGEPGLVARGPSPLATFAARHPNAPIVVDDPVLAVALRAQFGKQVAFESGALDAFEDDIAALTSPDINLPGGMRASIHPTPALVAIDLDMASGTADRQSQYRSQHAGNLAALPALARQIRLRNLSGAILIDFAGLGVKRRGQLGPALGAALATDPMQPRLLGFTALGLAEIVRKRQRPALHELRSGPHAAGLEALRAMARESTAEPHRRLRLLAAPDVIAALQRDAVARAALADRTGHPLIAKPEPALVPGAWRIERDA